MSGAAHDESRHDSVTSLLARFEKKKSPTSSGPPSPLFTPSPSRGSFARSPSTTSQASDAGSIGNGLRSMRSASGLTIPRTPSTSAPRSPTLLSSPLEKKASESSLSPKDHAAITSPLPTDNSISVTSAEDTVDTPKAEPPVISVTIPNTDSTKEDDVPTVIPNIPSTAAVPDDALATTQAIEDSTPQDNSTFNSSSQSPAVADPSELPTAVSLVEAVHTQQAETEVLAEPILEVNLVIPVVDAASLAAEPTQIAPAGVEETSHTNVPAQLPVTEEPSATDAPVGSDSSVEPASVTTSSEETSVHASSIKEAEIIPDAGVVSSSTVSAKDPAIEASRLAASPNGTKPLQTETTEAAPQTSTITPATTTTMISPKEHGPEITSTSPVLVAPSPQPTSPSKTPATQIATFDNSVKVTPSAPSTPRKSVVVTRTSISPSSPISPKSPTSPTRSTKLAVPSSPSPVPPVPAATTETSNTEAMPIWAQFARNTILFADDAAPLDLGLSLPSPPVSPTIANRPSEDVRPSVSSAMSNAPTLPKIDLDTPASPSPPLTEATPTAVNETTANATPAVPTSSDAPLPASSGPARAMTAKRASLLAAKKSLDGGSAEASRRKTKTRSVNPFAALFRAFGKRNKRGSQRRKSAVVEGDQ